MKQNIKLVLYKLYTCIKYDIRLNLQCVQNRFYYTVLGRFT